MSARITLGVLLLAALGCGDDDAKAPADTTPGDVPDTSDTRDTSGADSEDSAEDSAAEVDSSADSVEPDGEVPDTVDAPDTPDTVDAIDADDADDTNEVADGSDAIDGSTEPLDPDLEPCEEPQYWPFSVTSRRLPLRVHYRVPEEADAARESLGLLEDAWPIEVDTLGFAPPPDDEGLCGPDGSFDVFIWRDAEDVFVAIWQENDATPWDDGYPYMVVDPWGPYGGDELPVTLAHELNHACQANYDWSDAAFIYEATSTAIEDEVFDEHNSYRTILFDFQGNPDWSLDRDDGYETWYMYGAGLWLRYLRDRFFKEDASFLSELWEGMRSPADENEPDFADSLDAMLVPHGKSYADTVVEFARWRWYVGERDDGRHLEEAGAFGRDASPAVAAELAAAGGSATVTPMMLGTVYIDVAGDAAGSFTVALETAVPAGEVQWVVQALPGLDGSDGELLALPAEVALGDGFVRTLVVTALPGPDGDIDPDTRSDQRFSATLRVGAP